MPKPKYTFAAPVESLDELANLHIGHTIYHRTNRNADDTPQRWRVNGQMKRWKREPSHIRLPLKHGLFHHYAVTSLNDFNEWFAISYT